MTQQTSMLHVRIDDDIKQQAQSTLKELGLSMSEAIRVFLTKVVKEQGIPFEMKIPNKQTLKSFAEADEIIQKKQARFADADTLFAQLDSSENKDGK